MGWRIKNTLSPLVFTMMKYVRSHPKHVKGRWNSDPSGMSFHKTFLPLVFQKDTQTDRFMHMRWGQMRIYVGCRSRTSEGFGELLLKNFVKKLPKPVLPSACHSKAIAGG